MAGDNVLHRRMVTRTARDANRDDFGLMRLASIGQDMHRNRGSSLQVSCTSQALREGVAASERSSGRSRTTNERLMAEGS
jgi:hypothetical protein